MPLSSLLLLLAMAPSGGAPCVADVEQSVGPSSADVEIEAFFDPASTQSLRAWLELHQLVADSDGRTRATVRWVGTGADHDPLRGRVRGFVAALAVAGHTTAALRVINRDGSARLHARLIDTASHKALAAELGVSATTLESALTDRCAASKVDQQTATLRQQIGTDHGAVLRLPTFVVEHFAIDDGPALDSVRAEVGRYGERRRRYEAPRPPSPPPSKPAISDRMERPALGGLLLGGPGLAHRLVIMARDESDVSIIAGLPAALDLRRELPQRVAVHVVARGASSGAVILRQRLCAAHHLGLGAAYVDYLSRDPDFRSPRDPVVESLLITLDKYEPATCSEDVDPISLDLPDGTWLDGWPRSRGELGTLPNTVRNLDAAVRPLDMLLLAAERDP